MVKNNTQILNIYTEFRKTFRDFTFSQGYSRAVTFFQVFPGLSSDFQGLTTQQCH